MFLGTICAEELNPYSQSASQQQGPKRSSESKTEHVNLRLHRFEKRHTEKDWEVKINALFCEIIKNFRAGKDLSITTNKESQKLKHYWTIWSSPTPLFTKHNNNPNQNKCFKQADHVFLGTLSCGPQRSSSVTQPHLLQFQGAQSTSKLPDLRTTLPARSQVRGQGRPSPQPRRAARLPGAPGLTR